VSEDDEKRVWLAISTDGYSASTINGVFETQEAAECFKKNLPAGWQHDDCDIEEHVIGHAS